MAYVSQDLKKKLEPGIKSILKKYNLKGSLRVRSHSTLVLTLKSGKLDFIGNWVDNTEKVNAERMPWKREVIDSVVKSQHVDVNTYHIDCQFTGQCGEALEALKEAMSVGNWDNSDPQCDHFDTGWYVNINIGQYDQPYKVIAA
jgi:hypothetical protein